MKQYQLLIGLALVAAAIVAAAFILKSDNGRFMPFTRDTMLNMSFDTATGQTK